jgi:anti-sigma factor RsiW
VTCDAERVTGFVDGELDAASMAEVAAHLEACPTCREQAEAERRLRGELAALRSPDLPAGLEARLRARARRRPVAAAARWALPLAAVLLLGLWARGHAPLVAWELSRDHHHCFSRRPLPAKVWSGEPGVVGEWFERQGTHVPPLPEKVGDLVLVGARYCPLPDVSLAPHAYYVSDRRHVSVFVVPHGVRLRDRFAGTTRGDAVRLLRVEGEVVGIVSEEEADVGAFESAFRPILAAWAAHPEGDDRAGARGAR